MNRLIVFCTLFIALMFQSVSFGQMRNWTGSNGKVIQGEFLEYNPDTEIVKLKLKDGRTSNVKISLFSQADQDFVRNQGKTDDPFGGNNDEPSNEIIRVSLEVDEYGNCKLRAEKTSEPAKSTFEGKEIKVGILPKTKIKMNDKGITNYILDFKDGDSVLFCGHTWSGTKIDEEAKMLVLDPSRNKSGITLMGFGSEQFKLPFGVVCDVAKFNGELFNYEMLFEPPTTMERAIFTCRVASTSGIVGPYMVQCRWGKPAEKDWIFQNIFVADNLTLDKPFERDFRFPIPNKEITNAFRTSVGKNLNTSEKPPTDLTPIGITRLEFTGPFSPPLSIWLQAEGPNVFVKWVRPDGIGVKAGIQEGDIVLSINGIKPKNLQSANEMLTGTSFEEPLKIKVERSGKQQEIVVFEK